MVVSGPEFFWSFYWSDSVRQSRCWLTQILPSSPALIGRPMFRWTNTHYTVMYILYIVMWYENNACKINIFLQFVVAILPTTAISGHTFHQTLSQNLDLNILNISKFSI